MKNKPLYIPEIFNDIKEPTEKQVNDLIKKGVEVRYKFRLQEIIVTAWYSYPTYDFIFGVPVGKMAEKEKACMVIRDIKNIRALWFDEQELDDTIKALVDIVGSKQIKK